MIADKIKALMETGYCGTGKEISTMLKAPETSIASAFRTFGHWAGKSRQDGLSVTIKGMDKDVVLRRMIKNMYEHTIPPGAMEALSESIGITAFALAKAVQIHDSYMYPIIRAGVFPTKTIGGKIHLYRPTEEHIHQLCESNLAWIEPAVDKKTTPVTIYTGIPQDYTGPLRCMKDYAAAGYTVFNPFKVLKS
jgi:hypothetical protein